jgi:hypothetical protein
VPVVPPRFQGTYMPVWFGFSMATP